MSTSWINDIKPGQGWMYNLAIITYSGDKDPNQNLDIYYNSLGLTTVWTSELKP